MFCLIVFISLVAIYLFIDWLIRLPKVGKYDKKYVFITGSGSGYGRELALRLDKMGFPVFASCRTQEAATSLGQAGSSRMKTLVVDVTNTDSIQAGLDFIKRNLPDERALWAVVNNAGRLGPLAVCEMCTKQGYIDTCQVNLFGAIEVSRLFMPLLRKSRGRLVNMTSMMGRCSALYAPYCVSKFGLEAFSDIVRRQVAPFGIKVSIIEPGYTRTPLLEPERLTKAAKDAWDATSPEIQAVYGEATLRHTLNSLGNALEFSSPDSYKVADAYVAAITCTYPRPRYVVGNDAKYFFIPLSFMPEWVSDRMYQMKAGVRS